MVDPYVDDPELGIVKKVGIAHANHFAGERLGDGTRIRARAVMVAETKSLGMR